jgi:hypothetical protein
MTLVRRADGWLFAPEDARRLAAIRIGLCGLLVVRLSITDYGAVPAPRAGIFDPHFYMKLFERMPSPDLVTALQICGIVAALLAAAGLAIRASLPLGVVCFLVLNGVRNSSGRVIVGDAVLTLCLLLLVACGRAASEAWSVRRGAKGASSGARYGWPIRTAMLVIALAYFFAGLQKWRYSGLPWVTSDNLRWILLGQAHPDGWALFVGDRPVLAHLFAAGTLLLETSFPLILFVPRLRWLFIPGAVAMHVGVQLAIGLDYSAQWLTLVIVFVNWPVVVAWLGRVVTPLSAAGEAA